MPIIFQGTITRQDLRANPSCLYLFGDNEARAGLGGQAKAMRGEPNAWGIRTKGAPSNDPGSFWIEGNNPGQYRPMHFIKMVEADFSPVRAELSRNKCVIIPRDGLGTGRAQLDVNAPVTFAYLRACVRMLLNGRYEVPQQPDE